jgi:threonine/homoserine/homoserine lactone efflux protein
MNAIFVIAAGTISLFLTRRPIWARLQRWFMGTVLGFLAIRMATDTSR